MIQQPDSFIACLHLTHDVFINKQVNNIANIDLKKKIVLVSEACGLIQCNV